MTDVQKSNVTCFFLIYISALLSAMGCVRAYTPPTAAEPHSVLKLRRSYAMTKGTNLSERFLIQKKFNLFSQTVEARAAENPLIDGVLIHPEAAQIDATSSFFHYEMRMVRESYQEQEPYMDTETYSCGTGTSYQTCTRTVTRYRSVTRYRDVMKNVQVPDLTCSDRVIFLPMEGHTYLMEMTVQDHNVCALACFEQVPQPDGTFQNTQCQMLTALPEK
ncbi:MAG: hypothetical protein JXX14_04575 [Deltaproteobacteria bacterium]|nr:hypothetical protein [Deltaproteobacteria bacterium]